MSTHRRWLFADQLGPHFVDDLPDGGRVVMVESTDVFRRRTFHRRKAHLVLSALRHRAAQGQEAGHDVALVRAGTYREGLLAAGVTPQDPVDVVAPTTWAARRLVERLRVEGLVGRVLPARGFAVTQEEFAAWAHGRGRRRLLMDDFYREVRRHHHLLLAADGSPVGGSWVYDADNREPPPKGAATLADGGGDAAGMPGPWWPVEDEIDAGVRADLDAMAAEHAGSLSEAGAREADGSRPLFVGSDGPRRFAVTREEALAAMHHFLDHRLGAFGTYEDAMLAGDRWMAHSLLSAPMNLGLIHPLEAARAAEQAYRRRGTRLASVEGYVRQLVGWRDYVWHLYWYLGEDYRDANALGARGDLPGWWRDLDAGGTVEARCLSDVLASVREEGWAHHIPRLMVLGNYALQRGWSPQQLTAWMHEVFVDGYDWVMVANVVGMSQHADGGVLATKPCWSGGAYVDRMSDYCRPCRYDPKKRTGPDACPFTAGYWAFTARHAELLAGNHRTARAVAGLRRLADADEVVAQEADRGSSAP